jgi:hypothetical protein
MRLISHVSLITFLCALMIWTSCATPEKDETGLPAVAPEGEAKKESREGDDWRPPSPVADGSDWVRMSSGEWLRGESLCLRLSGELREASGESPNKSDYRLVPGAEYDF